MINNRKFLIISYFVVCVITMMFIKPSIVKSFNNEVAKENDIKAEASILKNDKVAMVKIETPKQNGTTSVSSKERKMQKVVETTTTKKNRNDKKDNEKSGSSYIGKFKVTGYTNEEGFLHGSSTSSGVPVGTGMCAMNNSQRKKIGIKYGDTIYIKGLGKYKVYDSGCSYNVIDIWFWTNAEAYAVTGYYDVYYN